MSRCVRFGGVSGKVCVLSEYFVCVVDISRVWLCSCNAVIVRWSVVCDEQRRFSVVLLVL